MEEQFSTYSTYFKVQRRTRWCLKSKNGFGKVKEKVDNSLLKRPAHIEPFSWKWWMNFQLLHKNRNEVMRNFWMIRNNAAYFGKFKPGTSCVLVQIQQRHGSLKSTPTLQEEHGTNLQDKSLRHSFPNLTGCQSIPKGELKARRQTHALQCRSRIFKKWYWSSWVQPVTSVCQTELVFVFWTGETGRSGKSPRSSFDSSYSKSLATFQFVSSTCCRRPLWVWQAEGQLSARSTVEGKLSTAHKKHGLMHLSKRQML